MPKPPSPKREAIEPSATSAPAGGAADVRGAGERAGRLSSALVTVASIGRIVHPFPSVLDAAVVVAIAGLDGASPSLVAALGGSMLSLQAAIGVANDVADVDRDRGRSDKPLAAGTLSVGLARGLALGLSMVGLGLAVLVGWQVLLVAVAGLVVGLAYDLRLRGTAWSWLPFALGIPLLPLFAWLGGSGCAPPAALLIVPMAIVGGAQLALSNGLADLDADRASGVTSVATALGPRRTWSLSTVLAAALGGVALSTAMVLGGSGPGLAVAAVSLLVIAGAAFLGIRKEPALRQLAWAVDCLGLAGLAVGWIAAVVGTGALPVPPC